MAKVIMAMMMMSACCERSHGQRRAGCIGLGKAADEWSRDTTQRLGETPSAMIVHLHYIPVPGGGRGIQTRPSAAVHIAEALEEGSRRTGRSILFA